MSAKAASGHGLSECQSRLILSWSSLGRNSSTKSSGHVRRISWATIDTDDTATCRIFAPPIHRMNGFCTEYLRVLMTQSTNDCSGYYGSPTVFASDEREAGRVAMTVNVTFVCVLYHNTGIGTSAKNVRFYATKVAKF